MEEQQSTKIIMWLKRTLGDKPISPYEVNSRTTDILYRLAECNEARDQDVSLVIDDVKQKTKEIAVMANYLKELLLESTGSSFTSFSRMGSSYLNELVESSLLLEVKDSSLPSFQQAVNDLTSNLVEAETKNRDMDLELTCLRKKLTKALVLEKTLKEDLRKTEDQCTADRAEMDRKAQNMSFLKAKSDEWKFRLKAAEDRLSASGMDDSLSHQSLVALSEKLAKLKEETLPLKKKLGSYLDLAPNPSLAQVKIEEAKREYMAVDAELTMKFDMVASYMA